MSNQRRSSRPSSAASYSSRTSGSSEHDLRLVCRAAFLGRYDDMRDEIESKDDLMLLLQQTGRNPSNKVISKYWSNNTDSLTFEDFVDVCKREPVTSEDDLMKAFRKIDLNGDGYISLDELLKLMTTKGEKMSRSQVKAMIDEVDENRDGKLDYKEFSKMIVSTADDFRKMSVKMMEKKEKRKLKKKDGDTTPRREKDELSLGSQLSLRSSASDNKRSRRRTSSSSNRHHNYDHNAEGARRTSHHSSYSTNPSKRQVADDNGWEVSEHNASRQSLTADISDDVLPTEHRASKQSLSACLQDDARSTEHTASRQSLEADAADDELTPVPSPQLSPKLEGGSRRPSRQSVLSKTSNDHSPKHSPVRSPELSSEHRASRVSLHSHVSNDNSPKQSPAESPEPSSEHRASRVSLHSHVSNANSADRRASKYSLAAEENEKESAHDRRGSRLSLRSNATNAGNERRASKQSTGHSLLDDDMSRPSPRDRRESRPKSASKMGRSQEPRNYKEWPSLSSKGTFFLDEDGSIVSHFYSLNLTEDTEVWITIQPLKIGESGESLDGTVTDTALLVLNEDDSSFVAFTENKDSRGKYSLRCNLSMGNYTLLPFTTGCRLKPRRDTSSKEAKLIIKDKEDKISLTRAFRKALEEIFEMADLDGNGLLSRDEFNWYNLRTSGDEVADDEWQVVEDNIELERGEITRGGFIKLNEMEADDNDGDCGDLWITLTTMGFNKSLILDEACPFMLKVYTQNCPDPDIKVMGLENNKEKIDNAFCDFVISKGEPTKVKGMKDLTLYQYSNDHRAIIVVENKSRTKIKMELDCRKRRGLVSHTGSLVATVTVPAQSSVVGHHILPLDDGGDFSVVCEENILK